MIGKINIFITISPARHSASSFVPAWPTAHSNYSFSAAFHITPPDNDVDLVGSFSIIIVKISEMMINY